ncbi:glutamate racemase [Bacillaceae bacterium]
MQKSIGIIDSGVGGLTVAREVMRQLPREKIVYFGDTARCPYGPRPVEEIRAFTHQMIRYLMQYHLKLLVIGCNTATAVVLPEIQQDDLLPVVGVIEPGARSAIQATKNGRIGVIGTVGTIRSKAYEKALKRINPDLYVVSYACPTLVPLVESGDLHSERALRIVADALAPLAGESIDTLILGCTHYPLLAHLIRQVMGDRVNLINSAEETAREVSALLAHRGMLAADDGDGMDVPDHPGHRFFTSGTPELFRRIAEEWLQQAVDVSHVSLEGICEVAG